MNTEKSKIDETLKVMMMVMDKKTKKAQEIQKSDIGADEKLKQIIAISLPYDRALLQSKQSFLEDGLSTEDYKYVYGKNGMGPFLTDESEAGIKKHEEAMKEYEAMSVAFESLKKFEDEYKEIQNEIKVLQDKISTIQEDRNFGVTRLKGDTTYEHARLVTSEVDHLSDGLYSKSSASSRTFNREKAEIYYNDLIEHNYSIDETVAILQNQIAAKQEEAAQYKPKGKTK